MTILKLTFFLFLMSIFSLLSGITHAQTKITGNCVNIAQNVTLGENSTIIQIAECFQPDPSKSFSIKYIWIDANNVSFLLAGFQEKLLAKVVGENLNVLKNPVYERISSIYKQYAERPIDGKTSFEIYSNQLMSGKKEAVQQQTESNDISETVRKRLKFLSSERNVVWPDFEASKLVASTRQWPNNMKMTYIAGDPPTNAIGTLNCVMLYDFVKSTELDNYWPVANELKRKLDQGKIKEDFLAAQEDNILSFDVDYINEGNRALRAIRGLADGSWPDDYLLKYGRATVNDPKDVGCGNNSFGFVAKPRQLFVLVAVITAMTSSISIDGIEYMIDGASGLRVDINENQRKLDRFAPLSIPRMQSLIIPLRLELRYNLDEDPLDAVIDNDNSKETYDAIIGLAGTRFSASQDKKIWISKDKNQFRSPEFVKVVRSYVSGEARSLAAISLDGTLYPVKPAPRSALVAYGEFEGGSCPFLTVQEGDGEWSTFGRVLVGASDPTLARVERIRLPNSISKLRIEEREPEVTYLRRLAFQEPGGAERTLMENIEIGPGQALEIKFPQELLAGGELIIQGYYRPLVSVAQQ